MKPDSLFVRQLRQAVRAGVQAKPALRRDYRKPPGWLRRQRIDLSFRWLVPPVFFCAAWLDAPHEILFGFASLWTLAVTFARARQLVDLSESTEQLWPYYQLPVSNASVAVLLRSRWARASCWLGADWLALGLGLALRHPGLVPGWIMVPVCGLAQAALAAALAAWTVRRWPKFPSVLGQVLAGLLVFACIQGYEKPWARTSYVLPTLQGALTLTPGGWLAQVYSLAATGTWLAGIGLAAIAVLSVLLIRPALDTFFGRFRMEHVFGYDNPDMTASLPFSAASGADEEELTATVNLASLPPVNPTALRARVDTLLAEVAASALLRGPLETAIRRTLGARQRLLIDCLRPNFLWGWSRSWCIALAGVLLAALIRLAGLNPLWTLIITTFALGIFALPVLGMLTSGFDAAPSFQSSIGHHSYLPVGFWECARLLLQIAFLRTLAGTPLLVLGIRHGYTQVPMGWLEACDWSVRVLLLVLAVQPVWVILASTRTTNDFSARWWFTALIILAMIGGLINLVGSAVVMAGLPELRSAAAMGLQFLVYTHALLIGYGIAYRFNVFDLMNRPRSGGE